ncbi:phosphatidylglycerophosphatase A [uncultured Campylobacter sp.]|uniref:phosphatidylglycerophosphatase A family protein n=1 Tax=uncultured Campylobacter sp. TaxID=218934 RepID=UPI0026346E94|nr:phosphatidylglycerophosphatase A [uncultured Campylobacter sp.]
MRKIFLTFFYFGSVSVAPGTFGTIAALIPAFFVLKYLGVQTLFLLCILIFLAGISSVNAYEQEGGEHDNKHIVIDEVAGVFLALSVYGSTVFSFILSFVFFRIFDITKPSIIRRVDENVKGGLGVMLDDILAGALAGLCCAIVCGILQKFNLLTWDIAIKDLF